MVDQTAVNFAALAFAPKPKSETEVMDDEVDRLDVIAANIDATTLQILWPRPLQLSSANWVVAQHFETLITRKLAAKQKSLLDKNACPLARSLAHKNRRVS